MAKSRPSVQKRNLEARKLDRKQLKASRRAAREAEKAARAAQLEAGVDPDLVGIVPGPQPTREDDEDGWYPEI